MTLTYPALAAARRIVWLVTGAEKREPLAKLLAGDDSIPAGRVANDDMIVVADEAAAAAECVSEFANIHYESFSPGRSGYPISLAGREIHESQRPQPGRACARRRGFLAIGRERLPQGPSRGGADTLARLAAAGGLELGSIPARPPVDP